MIQRENYLNIQGWMITELGLSGNELLCYALIYGFCQDGQNVFSGSSTYISEWLNISKRATLDLLKRLVEKNMILKIERNVNGVKFCDYQTSGVVKKLQGGGEETSPHNIEDNNLKKNLNKKKDEARLAELTKKMLMEQAEKKYGGSNNE